MAELLGQWLVGYVRVYPKGLDHPLHHSPHVTNHPHLGNRRTYHQKPRRTHNRHKPLHMKHLATICHGTSNRLPLHYHKLATPIQSHHLRIITRKPRQHRIHTRTLRRHTMPPQQHHSRRHLPRLQHPRQHQPQKHPSLPSRSNNLPQPTPNNPPIPSTQPHTRNKIPR